MVSTSFSKRVKEIVLSAQNWVKDNKLEAILLFIILLTALFSRLYRIGEYMTFLGDEGRDAIIVRRFLVDFDLMLIGPGTSIGDMYLGPLYYYLMAPALFFANLSPVGPAVMIALFGVATVFFVWYIAREWFPTTPRLRRTSHSSLKPGKVGFTFKGTNLRGINFAALAASALYAAAPVVIIYSRSSWNPNIMPFFALICIYSIWKVWNKLKFKWLIVSGISMAFVLQSHYLGLLLIPTLGIFWLLALIKIRKLKPPGKQKTAKANFIKYSLVSLGIFVFLMSPLLIFDARHGWQNFDSVKTFFTERQTTVSARPWSSIPKLPEIANTVLTSLIGAHDERLGFIATYVFLVITLVLFVTVLQSAVTKRKSLFQEKYLSPMIIIFIWLVVGFIGFGVYKQHIYDHYFGFLFPAPFLLLAGMLHYLINHVKAVGKIFSGAVFVLLLNLNFQNSPLKHPPARQYQRSVEVGEKIINEAMGEKFNLAVIAERNYEGAYQYHLERKRAPIVMIDPQRADDTIADQLFVVCEMSRDECDPTHNPKAQVANFGWSKIEEEWEIAGVTLFKLVHTKEREIN